MPGTTGFEVFEKIRCIDGFQRLPIITILTSSDSELDRKEAERSKQTSSWSNSPVSLTLWT